MIKQTGVFLLIVLPATSIASDITCSLSGKSQYTAFSTYAKQELRDVKVVLSLDTEDINGETLVNGYTTDYVDYEVQAAGIRLLNGPDVKVTEKWITISESDAVSDVINTELTMYSKRVRINRYSGVATFSMSIWDTIELGSETIRRTQEVALTGDCTANNKPRF